MIRADREQLGWRQMVFRGRERTNRRLGGWPPTVIANTLLISRHLSFLVLAVWHDYHVNPMLGGGGLGWAMHAFMH